MIHERKNIAFFKESNLRFFSSYNQLKLEEAAIAFFSFLLPPRVFKNFLFFTLLPYFYSIFILKQRQ